MTRTVVRPLEALLTVVPESTSSQSERRTAGRMDPGERDNQAVEELIATACFEDISSSSVAINGFPTLHNLGINGLKQNDPDETAAESEAS